MHKRSILFQRRETGYFFPPVMVNMYKKCIMLFTALLLAGIAVTAVADGLEMDLLMNMKLDQWGKMRAEGMFGPNRVGSVTQKVPCSGGKAGEYECDHVDLLSFLSHEDLGSTTRHGNDVWGMFCDLVQC